MISFVSFAESRGGAAKAALKFFKAIRPFTESQYVVVEPDQSHSVAIAPPKLEFYWHLFKRVIALVLSHLQINKKNTKNSLNIFSSSFVLNAIQNSDLVHLHWINNEVISLKDLARIRSKIIITLHDEWFFCGTEHYALNSLRPFIGYLPFNKNVKGIDLDRLIWNIKVHTLNSLKDRLILTVPSNWMLIRAKESVALKDFDVRLIPNIIDIKKFRPLEELYLRDSLGIPKDKKVIVFGAIYGKQMQVKGLSILKKAFEILKNTNKFDNLLLVSFGGVTIGQHENMHFKCLELGLINSDEVARVLNLASFTVVPSLAESFGQVAAESLACGTPVLAFDNSGIQDIVTHKTTGFLAKPFSAESLSEGMEWLLTLDNQLINTMSKNCRNHIVSKFSEDVVAEKLFSLYKEMGLII